MPEPQAFVNSRPLKPEPARKSQAVLGRFELRRKLGQGAQSTVWLAYDPRMEREVAIKVLRAPDSDEQAVTQWLQEARSVGRVKHPSIVPVFEADIAERQAYLVFEYVEGETLAQHLSQHGAMPAARAVALMTDVVDAVAVAHVEGVIHRDIKPGNILLDASGRARVLDFGIAARVRSSGPAGAPATGGTVGYLAPEALAGTPPAPSVDIFACGLVLAEMLAGRPLVDTRDAHRAMYQVAHETLQLTPEMAPAVDDRLRSMVNRALARDPQQRFGEARAFFKELVAWAALAGDAQNGDASAAAANAGTLDFLLRRMRHKSDFPALSDAVMRIQSMATSETESVSSVTNEILKDVALTNKLLRVVNSAHYARGGSISTVSRAVTLVGFNGIRNMALSLVLLEHMHDRNHAAQLKDEFLRSLMAGTLGGELCPGLRESEEAFIGSMFQNLGRLLAQFYFAEEAAQIRKLVHAARVPVSEDVAAVRVLGLSFEELGVGVAKVWGLPAGIQRCMRKPSGPPPAHASADVSERIRWIALAANEIADTLIQFEPKEAAQRVEQIARKYSHAMASSGKDILAATDRARQKLVEMADAMEIRVHAQSPGGKLLHVETLAQAPQEGGEAQFAQFELQATQSMPAGLGPERSARIAETLAAGVQDIANAMVEDFKLSDVLRMVLETMYRAMQLDRVIFCMRDARTEMMTGRFGLGQDVEAYARAFRVNLRAATPDLFGVVCLKGVDTMISDASQARIVQRLPDWYFKSLNAPAFLLLPLQIKGAPLGLIYADKLTRGMLDLDEKELALMRTLRNQAVMAFKQSS